MAEFKDFKGFSINWIKGEKIASVVAPSGTAMCNALKRYAEERPEDVTIRATNPDGSILAHVPAAWVSIRPPKQMNLTNEQRAERAEKMRALRG